MRRRISILWLILLAPLGSAWAGRVQPQLTHNGLPPDPPDLIKYYVYEEDSEGQKNPVAWGDSLREVTVEDGTYDIHARFRQGFIERNKRWSSVEIEGDLPLAFDFKIPTARLRIDVLRGGVQVDPYTSRVAVFQQGARDRPIGRERPGRPMVMRPGVYDIEVTSMGPDGLDTTWLLDVPVDGDSIQSVAFSAPKAFLAVVIKSGTRAIGPSRARWRAYPAGRRDEPVGERGSGMLMSLPEGLYDLELIVDGRRGGETVQWIEAVDVRGEMSREFDIGGVGDFVVQAPGLGRRAGQTWYGLFDSRDDDRPVAWERIGRPVEAPPGTYDLGLFLRDGSTRLDYWEVAQVQPGTEWVIDPGFRPAYLRVNPEKRRRRSRDLTGEDVWLVVDRSRGIERSSGRESWWDELGNALGETLPDIDSDLRVGLSFAGGIDGDRQCVATESVVRPTRNGKTAAVEALADTRPAGVAPLGYAISQLPVDVAYPARSLVLITASPDGCGQDVCARVAAALRSGAFGRAWVVTLGMDRPTARPVDCAGEWVQVEAPGRLRGALRQVLRAAARPGPGVVNVLDDRGVVAMGTLGQRLSLAEGRYEVLIHTARDLFRWPDLNVRGTTERTAGSRP